MNLFKKADNPEIKFSTCYGCQVCCVSKLQWTGLDIETHILCCDTDDITLFLVEVEW